MKLEKNTVVHCPTEELANKVLKIAHDSGYEWSNTHSYIDCNFWDVYKKDTSYNIFGGAYSYLDYYKEIGYKIISAQQFLKDNQVNQNKMKYYLTDTVIINGVERDVTISVFLEDTQLYAGYSVRNPIDENFDLEKAKLISKGRAFNNRTNLMKGESVGTLAHRYILKAIAENLLREISSGKIVIKGVR